MEKNDKKEGIIIGNAYTREGGRMSIKLNNKNLKQLVEMLNGHGETKLKGKTAEETARAESVWLNLYPSKNKDFKSSHVVIVYE